MKAFLLVLVAALAILLFPVPANHHLRNVYRQTVAHWLSKVVPPPTVFIGDSITNNGGWFDSLRNINLASNGLITAQIADGLTQAQAYHPGHIVVMAGMNDALRGFDAGQVQRVWETICKEPSIVVTLVSPSDDDALNRKIDQLNRIASDTCRGRPILALDVGDEHGRLKPEFASDSIHLGPKAYDQWVAKLAELH